MAVSNSKQKFPLRSEVAKNLETGVAAGSPSSAEAGSQKRLLEVLAGKEAVTAVLLVDFVNWKNPTSAPPKAPASP